MHAILGGGALKKKKKTKLERGALEGMLSVSMSLAWYLVVASPSARSILYIYSFTPPATSQPLHMESDYVHRDRVFCCCCFTCPPHIGHWLLRLAFGAAPPPPILHVGVWLGWTEKERQPWVYFGASGILFDSLTVNAAQLRRFFVDSCKFCVCFLSLSFFVVLFCVIQWGGGGGGGWGRDKTRIQVRNTFYSVSFIIHSMQIRNTKSRLIYSPLDRMLSNLYNGHHQLRSSSSSSGWTGFQFNKTFVRFEEAHLSANYFNSAKWHEYIFIGYYLAANGMNDRPSRSLMIMIRCGGCLVSTCPINSRPAISLLLCRIPSIHYNIFITDKV